ncbi:hypothetical protein NAPIS_ORF01659 [Vairimorpha apis BRL 01]|uniref:Uncharacterized protein n=1 Tax=Vairimorpha apis BRL 01 TaxID=1037528 RepID=T0L8E3_9MICR|nr:hypothetical protein NAPIS_ORF01659 [Vairimorpha apis BRL 01]
MKLFIKKSLVCVLKSLIKKLFFLYTSNNLSFYIKGTLVKDSLLSQTSVANNNELCFYKNIDLGQNTMYCIDINDYLPRERQNKDVYINKIYTFMGSFMFQKISECINVKYKKLEFTFLYKKRKMAKIICRIKKNVLYCNRDIQKNLDGFSNEKIMENNFKNKDTIINIVSDTTVKSTPSIDLFNDISLFECLENTLS